MSLLPINVQLLVNPTDEVYATAICPHCNTLSVMDKDQYYGKVSILCDCGYHETHDLSKLEKESE